MSFPNRETEIIMYIRDTGSPEAVKALQANILSLFDRMVLDWEEEIEDLIQEGDLLQALKMMKERVKNPKFSTLERYKPQTISLISELNRLTKTEIVRGSSDNEFSSKEGDLTYRIIKLNSSIFDSLRKIGKTKKR